LALPLVLATPMLLVAERLMGTQAWVRFHHICEHMNPFIPQEFAKIHPDATQKKKAGALTLSTADG
jgi:hypothetical protein